MKKKIKKLSLKKQVITNLQNQALNNVRGGETVHTCGICDTDGPDGSCDCTGVRTVETCNEFVCP